MKAKWKMRTKVYEGEFDIFNFGDAIANDFLWQFVPHYPGLNSIKSNVLLDTREAALEDAKAHGIEIIYES